MQVNCPKCGEETEVAPVKVLQPGDAALQQLFEGRLNHFNCGSCTADFQVEAPLLFRDRENPCLVYCLETTDPEQMAEVEGSMDDVVKQFVSDEEEDEMPECRITFSRRSLIEKIALHLQDLDDRIIEYVKYQLFRNEEGALDSVRQELLYDFSTSDPKALAFIVFDRESGKATAGAHIPLEVYQEISDHFLGNDQIATELEKLFPGYNVTVDKLL